MRRDVGKWKPYCLALLWFAGAFVVANRILDDEPLINIMLYAGGLLVASHIIANALRKGSQPRDWALLVGVSLLMVYGWWSIFPSKGNLTFSLEIAAVAVVALGAFGSFVAYLWIGKTVGKSFKLICRLAAGACPAVRKSFRMAKGRLPASFS